MTRFLLAVFVLAGFAAPAYAGGCCDGIPAPLRGFILVTNEQPAPAATDEAAADAEIVDQEIPPSEEATDIIVSIHSSPKFSTLATALDASGLSDTLSKEGPFTIFAPTNEAFESLPDGELEALLKPENKDKLISILSYHVISGAETSSDIPTGASEPATVQGTTISINKSDAGVTVDDARVTDTDIPASNGVIHAIDKVIRP